MNTIEKAFQFALHKHRGQFRKGTDIPYITHPFAVSMILKHHQYSDDIVAAGLLHDTLEDTDTTANEIQCQFGDKVLDLVLAASEQDKTLSWEERKRHTIKELARKNTDQLAVIVADKLHNLRSIQEDVDCVGDDVWSRFNRGKREQSWYYMSIVNALKPVMKDMRLVRILEVEVKRLFVGTSKLRDNEIDRLFNVVYDLSPTEEEEFKKLGIIDFVYEVKVAADTVYKNQDFDVIRPLMDELTDRGIKFELNSDGPLIVLAFCNELQHRLGWSADDMYRHVKRNIGKL
ncbi:hypothetical protein CSV72_02375 [Sporosarcina sp. P20a]|uniref:HD domain-containing protein n=1 Tax=Sporosarcina sp. P20a TaxID=2048256 RepID=UPI000C16B0C3|nr:HD domain-containing protein [Sporosarcina sp. P20a]PIC88232.1 hypothetical protein CSV72_02375 [Sporosarcina sp. P20a]